MSKFSFPILLMVIVLPFISVRAQNPPKETTLFLFIGHSNMAGRAVKDTKTHSRAWNYKIDQASHAWGLATDVIHNEKYQSTNSANCAATEGGPAMHFLKQIVLLYPDKHFAVLQNAHTKGTVSFDAHDLKPSQSCNPIDANVGMTVKNGGNRMYQKSNGVLYREIMNAAKEIKGQVVFGGMVTMLGAIEARNNRISGFAAAFAQMVKDMRVEIGIEFPVYALQLEQSGWDEYSPDNSDMKAMRAEIQKISGTRIAVVSTDWGYKKTEYNVDNHHYNAKGHERAMQEVIAVMRANKWDNWGAVAIDHTAGSNFRSSAPGTVRLSLQAAGLTILDNNNGMRWNSLGKAIHSSPQSKFIFQRQ